MELYSSVTQGDVVPPCVLQNYLHPIMEGGVEGVVGGKDISEVAPIIFGNIEEILHFHEE